MGTWFKLAAVIAAAGGLAAAVHTASAQQHREAGAHEHGRGTLNIALEGTRLSMELEAPGADIVGFEHEAKTDQQKAAIEKAELKLMAPEALFQLPAAAGCVSDVSGVSLESGEHDHDDDKGHGHGHGAKGHGHKDGKADEHSSFRAEYTFNCKTPASLTGIAFNYFKVFAGAQKLDVTVITPKGQSKFEVSRDKPHLDLAGMM